jgi:biotin carboxylase
MDPRPPTILCLASYVKGQEFLRECKRLGCRVLLLTREKHRDAHWPREHIDEVYLMPDLHRRKDVIHGVSYLARTETIDRIVPLDEFDLEMASTLREHLRIPGMGETTVRYFRDKLAMRMRAREAGVLVPEFVPVLNHERVREYMERVPPPWVLKPRLSASAMGIKKLHDPAELWRIVEGLGDRQSFHLLERFVPGDVFHVDSIVWAREVLFVETHGYLNPPFEVYHGGGLFCTRTLERGSADERALTELTREIVRALGLVRGALHTEFIRSAADGRFYFLETAARVGGANIVEMVEAATGVNLWREWARLEVADVRAEQYAVPPRRRDYAGVLISLARQEWPDTSAYADPEIVWRMSKRHHVGLIVASPDRGRVEQLLASYLRRFRDEFYASVPAAEEAVD